MQIMFILKVAEVWIVRFYGSYSVYTGIIILLLIILPMECTYVSQFGATVI